MDHPQTNVGRSPAKKRSFFGSLEELDFRPSTELIPDEYPHIANEKISLHIFVQESAEDIDEQLLETMQALGYDVDWDHNVHFLEDRKQIDADLNLIKNDLANKVALILIFIGIAQEEGTLLLVDEHKRGETIPVRNIWNKFSASQCFELRDKPKVFLFCISKWMKVKTDARQLLRYSYNKFYEFPAESDMLIIYKGCEDTSMNPVANFIKNFCRTISEHSKKHDIIDLITHAHKDDQKALPLIISTLTRKFYLTTSNQREHYLAIDENNSNINQNITEVMKGLLTLQDSLKKKNFFSSLRMKSEDKPKIVKKSPVSQEVKEDKKIENTSGRPSVTSNGSTAPGQRRRTSSSTTQPDRPRWRP